MSVEEVFVSSDLPNREVVVSSLDGELDGR